MSEIFETENIKLVCDDCLVAMQDIKEKSIDMILCDLPYGVTHLKWDKQIPTPRIWDSYKRIIKDNGAIVLFGQEPFSSFLRISNIDWYRYDWVWEKTTPTGFLNARKRPLVYHEVISVFYKKQCTYNPQMVEADKIIRRRTAQCSSLYNKYKESYYESDKRYPKSIQKFPKDAHTKNFHSSQKPVKLLEYLVKTYTNQGEIVLDNCMGSGSTGVACVKTGRRFYGIEIDEEYFEISKKRIQKEMSDICGKEK